MSPRFALSSSRIARARVGRDDCVSVHEARTDLRVKTCSSIARARIILLFFLMNCLDGISRLVLLQAQQTLYRRGLIQEGLFVPSSCAPSMPIGTRS